VAYATLRWIGAAYLVYVGYQMLRHPRRGFLPDAPRDEGSRRAFTT
jgi:threonine/homoserine/homoserine lactone efflux protein